MSESSPKSRASQTMLSNSVLPKVMTPFLHPEIESIIAYINEDYLDEIQNFLQVFKNVSVDELKNFDAKLTDIYAEGMRIKLQPKADKRVNPKPLDDSSALEGSLSNKTYYIAFKQPISTIEELQMQYVLLKQHADKKIGKKTIQLVEQNFKVKDSYRVSKNILRLVLTPTDNGKQTYEDTQNLLSHEAGYAYLFDLTTPQPINPPKRQHCYYTLRKAFPVTTESGNTDDTIEAWVDVYDHGDTSGSNWAKSLQPNDTIKSKREFPEKTGHLNEGQALLIADETSMPTVARLIETWRNPIPPLILCLTHDEADQAYFEDAHLNTNIDTDITILPLITGDACNGEALALIIDGFLEDYLAYNPLKIDKIWGALEASTVKKLRPMLRKRFDLDHSNVVVKVYWRKD